MKYILGQIQALLYNVLISVGAVFCRWFTLRHQTTLCYTYNTLDTDQQRSLTTKTRGTSECVTETYLSIIRKLVGILHTQPACVQCLKVETTRRTDNTTMTIRI